MNYDKDLASWQSAYLFKAIQEADGDKRQAARNVGMGQSTFYRRWGLVEGAVQGTCNGLSPLRFAEDYLAQKREIEAVVAQIVAQEESFDERVQIEVAKSKSLVAEMEQRALLAEAKYARLLAVKSTPHPAEVSAVYEAFGL